MKPVRAQEASQCRVTECIPPRVLEASVQGSGLLLPLDASDSATLRDQLDPVRPTLLVFLRAFGCLFCREMVKDVRIASDKADSLEGGRGEKRGEKRYPRVVFVHQATPEQGARFFGRYWPGAPAISDPGKALYDAFGLSRGSLAQMYGPRVWACGLRATLKGHTMGRFMGDPWTMPGLFLLAPDGGLLHSHRCAHAADHPDFEQYAHLGGSAIHLEARSLQRAGDSSL